MKAKPLVKIFWRTKPAVPLRGFAVPDDPGFAFEVSDDAVYSPCDVAVFFGSHKPSLMSGKAAIKNSVYASHEGPKIIVETGFTGRSHRRLGWFKRVQVAFTRQGRLLSPVNALHRVGVNGVFGDDADFCNTNSPPDRWHAQSKELSISLKPYRRAGDHVLLIGQIPGDASLRGTSMFDWLSDSAKTIREMTDRPIRIRLHPNMNLALVERIREAVSGVPDTAILPIAVRSISEDLKDCWVCVTFSSSSSVDALIEGIPPICVSPANIAYKLCSQSLAEVESPRQPDRTQWFNDLAYAQWSPAEIARGDAWWHVRPRIIGLLQDRGWHFDVETDRQPYAGQEGL